MADGGDRISWSGFGPRLVRARAKNSENRPEALSNERPGQKAFSAVFPGHEDPLLFSGGQEVAGSNPASPTRETLLSGGFWFVGVVRRYEFLGFFLVDSEAWCGFVAHLA